MTRRWGIPAAIFALKCYLAAMLAIYIAFSIGLERPYWAFLTSFIVAGPLAGAVVSKAFYRLLGTLIGATFSVLVVPPLVQAPELLVLAMASWIAACVFVSLIDRTPRSYMFALAGYSTALIVFPTVEAPSTIFNVAALRAQEIAIGISCSALVHALVLPRSVTTFLIGRVEAVLRDAERWSEDALDPAPSRAELGERRRLATDIAELHQLSTHLPFETSRAAPRLKVVRALLGQFSFLLPLGAAVSDRIACLCERGALDPATVTLLEEARGWIGALAPDLDALEAEADRLVGKCRQLETAIAGRNDWDALLRLSLYARLAELLAAHRDCRILVRQVATRDRKPVSPRVPDLLSGTGEWPLHRDFPGALRGAATAFLVIVTGCTVWIASGWRDGATAAMLAGVFLSLFASLDSLSGLLKGFLKGAVVATIISAVYGFAILPSVEGFALLAAVLAPLLLVLGSMLAEPRTAGLALPVLLSIGNPFIITETFGAPLAPGVPADFAGFVNGQIAMFAGILFALVMARLLQAARVEQAIRHTLQAGWNDIATRATLMTAPDLQRWIARMLDRIALLSPRLAAVGKSAGDPLYDILGDMRTGVAIGELRQLRLDLAGEGREAGEPSISEVLEGVGAHYRLMRPDARAPEDPALVARIDRALEGWAGDADAALRRRAMLALVTLRRNLFPSVPLPAATGTPS